MSIVVQKKIRSYLAIKDDLHKKYVTITQKQVDTDLRQGLMDLYEFDQLCYSYYALKSYYDLSKSRWDLDYRNLLDDLSSLHLRIEDKIPVAELYLELPELSVLRREFRENAREGGKVAYLIVSLSVDMSVLKEILGVDIQKSTTGTPLEENNKRDSGKLAMHASVAELSTGYSSQSSQVSAPQPLVSHPKSSQSVVSHSIQSAVSHSTQPLISHSAQPVVSHSTQPYQPVVSPPSHFVTSQHLKPQPVVSQHLTVPSTPYQLAGSGAPSAFENHRSPGYHAFQFQLPQSLNDQRSHAYGASGHNVPPSASHAPTSFSPPSQTVLQQVNTKLSHSNPAVASSSFNASKRPSTSEDIVVKKRKNEDDDFGAFGTWTREHNYCIFKAVMDDPLRTSQSIYLAIYKQFGITLSQRAIATLELHYGYSDRTQDKYQYYIQAFHLVASQFHDNPNYVTVPWADIRLQFARKTGLTLADWEVRGRYLLFLLHRKVYGANGEPPSNYSDLVEEWKKLLNLRNLSPNLRASPPATQQQAGLEFQAGNTSISVEDEEQLWTPLYVDALIEAHSKLPLNLMNRMLVIKHYIKLKTNKEFDVKEIESRLRWRDVELGVSKLLRQREKEIKEVQMSASAANRISSAGTSLQTDSRNPQVNLGHTVHPTSAKQTASGATTQLSKPSSESSTNAPASVPAETNATAANIPASTPNHLAKAPVASQQTSSDGSGQFDQLLTRIEKLTKPDWYYKAKFKPSIYTDFWDYEKCKCVYVTVEFFAGVPADTPDLTLRVARSNLKKMTRLRLLRGFKIKVLENLVENKLMNMMEHDVFTPAMIKVTDRKSVV